MRARFVATALMVVGSSTVHANNSVPFTAGALIIPTSAAFQDDCGAVSAYGLVYNILRANVWLAANGKTPITVNYGYFDGKKSPNRCVPTNLDTPPSSPASATWNDGCDFTITAAAGTPVSLIRNATASTSVTDSTVHSQNRNGSATVYPGYSAQTVGATVKTIGYAGGPFVISSNDAPTFLQLLDGTLPAKDADGFAIDFTAFTQNKNACSFGTTHWVMIHRAKVAFTANIGQTFTQQPPRLALLAYNLGSSYGMTGTNTVTSGILEGYLKNAGLDFANAGGCPSGSILLNYPAVCPNGAQTGQIYDNFDFQDLVASKLTSTGGSGKPLYSMLWTPHWETNTNPNAAELSAMSKISTFLDGQNGLSAECASIASYEGDYLSGTGSLKSNMQLQTCSNGGSGNCGGGTTYGIDDVSSGSGLGKIQNCTDITVSNGSTCIFFDQPGDPYAQTGEFMWDVGYGYTRQYIPHPANSIYKPGVLPLISYVTTLDNTKIGTYTTARTLVSFDLTSRNIKDNTAGKSNVMYLAGHDQTGSVAGTKVMLQTLLQLAISTLVPPSNATEVSRATPIVASISGTDSIVQGTYEYVNPAPGVPVVNAAADVASFTFPYLKGHMRARTAVSVSTTASTFSSGIVLFDAGNAIPSVNNAGCGGNAFSGTCRTVFTTLATSGTGVTRNPALVFVQDGNADAIGTVIAPGLAHAQWVTLTERLLAGVPNGFGAFTAQLGGVDRSTVAVIGPSSFAGAGRATMIYYGATDGMLHAACGAIDPTHGCDVLGRELWAYLPRVQLPSVRTNTTRIDGSPRVTDMFGDFYNTGTRSFRTILTFQTGSGDVTTAGSTPAVYALDITDPQNPAVLWEYTIANPASRNVYELGQGETLGAGVVQIVGNAKPIVYAQTNNGGTGGAGTVLTAISAETGATQFQVGYAYPAPRVGGHSVVPPTGIPGGAVPLDKAGQGFVTDVTFADLYGDLWVVDPVTGASRTGATSLPLTTPLFSFTTDYHPIGAVPAIYSNASNLFAVLVTGGYADLLDSVWGTGVLQDIVVVKLSPTGSPTFPLTEGSGAPNVPIVISLGSNERGFSQATIVGNQFFVTTDSSDVNASGYGTSGASTGHVYGYNINSGTSTGTVVVASGASSVANDGTNLYGSSGTQQQQLGTPATSTVGPALNSMTTGRMVRELWLRTQ